MYSTISSTKKWKWSLLLKGDYEKHSGNTVGKGLKAPTRQKDFSSNTKKKGDRNLPEINQLCIVYEISSINLSTKIHNFCITQKERIDKRHWRYDKRALQHSVYRELKRNKGRHHYHYGVAQKQCDERKRRMRKPRKFSINMRKEIFALMVNEQWSPDQIRGWMLHNGETCVCIETIYSYIRFDRSCGGELYKSCRHKLKQIKRNHPVVYTAIKDRIMIDERDSQADGTRFGD